MIIRGTLTQKKQMSILDYLFNYQTPRLWITFKKTINSFNWTITAPVFVGKKPYLIVWENVIHYYKRKSKCKFEIFLRQNIVPCHSCQINFFLIIELSFCKHELNLTRRGEGKIFPRSNMYPWNPKIYLFGRNLQGRYISMYFLANANNQAIRGRNACVKFEGNLFLIAHLWKFVSNYIVWFHVSLFVPNLKLTQLTSRRVRRRVLK